LLELLIIYVFNTCTYTHRSRTQSTESTDAGHNPWSLPTCIHPPRALAARPPFARPPFFQGAGEGLGSVKTKSHLSPSEEEKKKKEEADEEEEVLQDLNPWTLPCVVQKKSFLRTVPVKNCTSIDTDDFPASVSRQVDCTFVCL